MVFQTFILGCSAATPTSLRYTTSQLLQYHNKFFLLDCGEGAQIQIRRFKLPLMKIDHVFISHLHGDHYLGLPGLLFSWHLLGRQKPVHIYSPAGLREIIELQFSAGNMTPCYEIVFHILDKPHEIVYQDRHITIETIGMNHRITTFGFLTREKQKPANLNPEVITKYNISIERIKKIKESNGFELPDVAFDPADQIFLPAIPPRSYAFCSDTGYSEDMLDQIKGVDLLYHEATFLSDMAKIACEKLHCTAIEAATIAHKANAGKLIIGHYSARYGNILAFEEEARTVFQNSILGQEGMCIRVGR